METTQTASKLLLAIVAVLALAACGTGDCEPVPAVVSPIANVSVVAPAPAPTPPPAPTVICTTEITTNCEILFCPQAGTTACPPSPKPVPRQPVVVTPTPPTCIRDDAPLVLVEGVLTDNCGSKYGTATF